MTLSEATDVVLSFLDELAANAAPGKRLALNPITIGGSAKLYADGLREACLSVAHPDWAAVYAGCVHEPDRDQELIAVTRETLRLAASAIRERNARDYYHNSGAALSEIEAALSPKEAQNAVPALHDCSVVPDPVRLGPDDRTCERPGDTGAGDAAGGGLAAVRNDGHPGGPAGADGLSEALIRACSTDLLQKEEIDAIGEIGQQVIAYIERVTEYQMNGGVQAGIQFTINQLAFELLVMRPKRLTADAVKSAIRAASPEREIVALIDKLRADEGDSVTILCDNPDFNGQPDRVIVANGAWTDWQDRRFGADTLVQALRAAVKAREAK